MTKEYRVGCVGCGGRGRTYSSMIHRIPGFKMYAYADIHKDKAEACLSEYGGDYATGDVDRVLTDPDIDVVFICTYHETHCPFVIKAAENGKHILVEKPMALTIEECEEMEDAVNKAGVKLACGFKMKFMPMIQKAKEVIGEPLMIVGQMMCGRWGDAIWAQQPKIGGGNVISQGCHTADVLCYLAGSDPVSVHAEGGTLTHSESDIIDNIVATIRFKNGVVASMIQGDAGQNPYTSKFFFEVFGSGKGACLYNRCHDVVFWGVEGLEHLSAESYSEDSKSDPEGDFALLKHFCECVVQNKPTMAGAQAGRIATTLVVKIFESIRTGRTQKL